jgi:penicillin-binding protein 1A
VVSLSVLYHRRCVVFGFGKRDPSTPKKKRGFIGWLVWSVKMFTFCLVLFVVGIALAGWGLYWADEKWGIVSSMLDLPDLNRVRQPFSQPSCVRDRNGLDMFCYADEYRIPIHYDEMGQNIISAIIASEDRHFEDHNSELWRLLNKVLRPGYDIRGIFRAAVTNTIEGRRAAGGSTIDQQIIKNRVLNSDRTYKRKLREAFLAIKMNQKFTREEVIEIYANMIYLGGPYGVEAAAQTYFEKHAFELAPDEAALLAGMISNSRPLVDMFNAGDPQRARLARDIAKARRDRVLRIMHDDNRLSDAEYEASLKKPIVAKPFRGGFERKLPYLSEMARLAIESMYKDLRSGGYNITTTFDIVLTRKLEEACAASVKQYVGRHPENATTIQCAAIVTDLSSGEVLALVGGQDFSKNQYNGVTLAKRPPGSAFKPISYAAYMEMLHAKVLRDREAMCLQLSTEDCERLKLAEIDLLDGCKVNDQDGLLVPAIVNHNGAVLTRKLIHNYPYETRRLYMGMIDCRLAVAESRNAAAVWAEGELGAGEETEAKRWQLGAKTVVDMAKRLGIESPLLPYPVIPLGFDDVTLWELSRAFIPLVNGGCKRELYFLKSVANQRGELRMFGEQKQVCDRVIAPEVARATRMLLEAAVDDRFGTAHRLRTSFTTGALACKTGTATLADGTSAAENLIVCATPTHLIAVRLNNIDRTPLGKKETGGKNGLFVVDHFLRNSGLVDPKGAFPELPPLRDTPDNSSSEGVPFTPDIPDPAQPQ